MVTYGGHALLRIFFFFGLENAIYHAIRVIMQFSNAVTSPAQPVQSLQFRMRYAFYMSILFGALLSRRNRNWRIACVRAC